ncbi:hypothetical protein KIF53_21050 [Chromobacterium subtsugae]|uniref:Uncharacterized protein n=1 Tax=Chromobacterium subtsugae TaxID=251747 RepID=A0ABS7FJ70_9NEIS|nr:MULTISPECIES: hypothetical protein [Chromobacterium]KUM04865.1 hypothetical protein Cv017_12205 [Chromobacterium subtsugae]KZE84816.1 hypothetical protein AWB61_21440 [Chromobacterium sp. F49]MBW7569086.1 hypothetical protein [Chromobacterium subtsugae]MBW8290134.1 hypothetical protein [Chromobacterium subtsugae]OBU85966.1 hypothetical protein MY55_12885 [Chromobacterium subtsugae]
MSTTAYYLLRKSVAGRRPAMVNAGAHAAIVPAPQPEPAAAPGEVRIIQHCQLQPAQAAQQRREHVVKSA